MNDDELSRLLDDAAAGYHPTPDLARLERMLPGRGGRRRGAVIVFSAAACLAMMGGVVAAVQSSPEPRLAPANESETTRAPQTTEPRPTEPTNTEHGTDTTTRPTTPRTEPKWDAPTPTDPKPTEPAATEPTAPPATEPKPTEPTEPRKPPTTEPPPTTKPPTTEPPPTTQPPEPTPWTAYQVYGSGSGSPPFDVFYGTAAPGHEIVIEAEHARAVGYANDAGNWEIHVEFPDSPIGVPIKVWVVSGDHVSTFWFVHTAPG